MIAFLGWTLVHAAWQGGLIAAAVAVLLWLARRAAASTQYVIALAGLAAAGVVPVSTTVATGRWSSDRAIVVLTPLTSPARAAHAALTGTKMSVAPRVIGSRADARPTPDGLAGAFPWIVAAWLFGVAALSLRMLVGIATVRRIGKRGVSAVDARVHAAADAVAARLRVSNTIRVLQSARVDVPMVIGWLRPALVVPVSLLAGLSTADLEMLLAHELAHIRRYDMAVNLAQTVVETLLFYHPAVWWLSARIREERENCCDDLALAATGRDRGEYGAMLLHLEERRAPTALAAAATGGSLVRRVRRLVRGGPERVDLGFNWFAGAATMLVVMVVATPTRVPAANAVAAARDTSMARPAASESLVHSPQRRTLMPQLSRRVLVVSTAATLGLAATTIGAQTPPHITGHWVPAAAAAQTTTAPDSSAVQSVDVEHSARTLTLTLRTATGDATLSYAIEAADADGVRAKGPTSLAIGNLQFAIDVPHDTLRLQGHVKIDATGDTLVLEGHAMEMVFNFAAAMNKKNLSLSLLTLSVNRAGELVVQTDVPATGDRSASRSVQRFRRAP